MFGISGNTRRSLFIASGCVGFALCAVLFERVEFKVAFRNSFVSGGHGGRLCGVDFVTRGRRVSLRDRPTLRAIAAAFKRSHPGSGGGRYVEGVFHFRSGAAVVMGLNIHFTDGGCSFICWTTTPVFGGARNWYRVFIPGPLPQKLRAGVRALIGRSRQE